MTIGERMKKLRKELHLTQQEFADRIGSVQNSITGYENGRRNPSAPVISLICREFSANEKWLRTGEGEMFAPKSRPEEIATLVEQLMTGENAEFKRRLIAALASLTEKQWMVIVEKAEEIVNGHTEQPRVQDLEAEARAEADEYYREILAQKKAAAAASATLREKDA